VKSRLPRKIIDSKPATTAEAKRILERVKDDELGEFQRRTLDYASKFSKVSPTKVEKLVKELTEKYQLEERVNPGSKLDAAIPGGAPNYTYG